MKDFLVMLKSVETPAKDMRFALGDTLRTRRKEMKLSMQAVADAAGLSVGFISQVERGLAAPSLGSLASISRVLEMRLSDILDQPDGSDETTRNEARQTYRVPGAEASYERISTAFNGARLHSVIVHEPPGHRAEPISHEGEEMIFVLAGSITFEIEDQVQVLGKGDSIHFDSRRVHSIWNHTAAQATILWCGTMDVFGDAPGPIHKNPEKPGPL